MILDKTHRTWAAASAVVLTVAAAAYWQFSATAVNGPTGGSPAGLMFGVVGAAFIVFAGLLAARRKVVTRRLGSMTFWLRGHIWLGLLSVPLILFHSGFGWGGAVEKLLWMSLAVVVLSGIFGLTLQQFLPRFLTLRVPAETFVEQIPYQCKRGQMLADRMIAVHCGPLDVPDEPLLPLFAELAKFSATSSREDRDKWIDVVNDPLRTLFVDLSKHAKLAWGKEWRIRTESDFPGVLPRIYDMTVSVGSPEKEHQAVNRPKRSETSAVARQDELRQFYLRHVRPFLSDTADSVQSVLNSISRVKLIFQEKRYQLPTALHDTLHELEQLCLQRRQFTIQRRIHRWLHGWLLLHIPISITLFCLMAAHIVMALRVVPF